MSRGASVVVNYPRAAIGELAAKLGAARASGQLIDVPAAHERPRDSTTALAVQGAVDRGPIGGWKCALPTADRLVLAPIAASTIVDAGLVWVQGAAVRYEPEIAFLLAADMPDGFDATAIGEARLALELVHGRFHDPDAIDFYTMLADDLFNEGLVLGPPVALEEIAKIAHVSIGGEHIPACHPTGDPLAPLIWLADYLAEQGTPLCAGMVIVTGAFIAARSVHHDEDVAVGFGNAGTLNVRFAFESMK